MRPLVLIYSRDPDFFLVFGHILGVAGFESQLLATDKPLPQGETVRLPWSWIVNQGTGRPRNFVRP